MPRAPRGLPPDHPLLGNEAGGVANSNLLADSARQYQVANIANFLRFMEARGDQFPVNATYMKIWNAGLAEMGYTGIGARRYHVWKWLQTPPPNGNFTGMDTTKWDPLRWRAEKQPVRLIGADSGTILGHIDEVEKECAKLECENEPTKAAPVLANNLLNAWNSFTTRERGIVCIAAACGTRMHSLYNVLPGDIVCTATHVTCYIRADKLKGSAGRMLHLHCACGERPGNPSHTALCPIHSGYVTPNLFPVRERECTRIHEALGITGHSWRRTLALRLRRRAEKDPLKISRAKVMRHFGWTDPERWAGYASDLRKWDGHDLLHTEEAVLTSVLRLGMEKEDKWKWFDAVQALGKVPKTVPVMRAPGQPKVPSHARTNGTGATGAKRTYAQLQVDDFGPAPKKTKFGQKVVEAKTPPRSPERKPHAGPGPTEKEKPQPQAPAPAPEWSAMRYILYGDGAPNKPAENAKAWSNAQAKPHNFAQPAGAASSSGKLAFDFSERPPATRAEIQGSKLKWDNVVSVGFVTIATELTEKQAPATQRLNIRAALHKEGLTNANGWRLEVKDYSSQDGKTFHIRGLCNRCPCQTKPDGTKLKDKRCDVICNGVFKEGGSTLQLRLQGGKHTNHMIKTIWPWKLSTELEPKSDNA